MRASIHTIGSIAKATGQPVHRIRYVIATRGIEPAGRAGTTRIFTDNDVQSIRSAIYQMSRMKEGRDA